MNQTRKDDVRPHAKFRASRYYNRAGQWFFRTREGVGQGPFDSRVEAQYALNTYTRVFRDLDFHSQVLTAGMHSSPSRLSLVPIQMQWR